MDELRIHQLTKEMVAEELRQLGDPCAAAAAVVRKTVSAALKSAAPGSAGLVVEDAVKGSMTALLLAEQSLSRGGILVLDAVLDVAAEAQMDPTEAMSAALHGLADLRRFTDPARLAEIQVEIEAKYMGAGEVFVQYLREPAPPAAPRAAR